MNRCTYPKHAGDTRYVFGRCTWHAPIARAAVTLQRIDTTSVGDDEPQFNDLEVPCCPTCRGVLFEMPTEAEWWAFVKASDRKNPGYEAMLRWSQGKCFPDYDMMQNVYRQAMEGQS